MENNVEKLLYDEAMVVLGQEVLEKLRAIYQLVLEEQDPQQCVQPMP